MSNKIYTVKEVAKKLRVSEGHIYDLIKKGTIKKVENLGTIRVSYDTLREFINNSTTFAEPSCDLTKVDLLETHIGKIRKLKNQDWYILKDLCNLIGVADSWTIRQRASEGVTRNMTQIEAQSYKIRTTHTGITLITYKGIAEYAYKTRTNINWGRFLNEIKIDTTASKSGVSESQTTIDIKEEGNGLQILEQREVLGKQFRIYGTKENPLFLAKDVAEWIEHSQSIRMIENIDAEEKVMNIVHTPGGNQQAWFLTEDGLYEVLMQSRKPIAKEFKKQVKVILKQIRTTGGYVANEVKFVDNYFANFSEETKKIMIADLKSKNKQLFIEKERVDSELLKNIHAIKEIEGVVHGQRGM